MKRTPDQKRWDVVFDAYLRAVPNSADSRKKFLAFVAVDYELYPHREVYKQLAAPTPADQPINEDR